MWLNICCDVDLTHLFLVMKKILFALTVLFTINISAQSDSLEFKDETKGTVRETYHTLYSTSIKQGEYKMYYNNVLLCKGYYYNGLKHGPWTKYYPSGKISTAGAYAKGRKNGVWKFFYENGTLASVSQFEKGEKRGIWLGYYMNGDTSVVMHYGNDDNEAAYIEKITSYYQKKKSQQKQVSKKYKEIITEVKDAVFYDEVSLYYKSGNLYKHNFYIDNKPDGPYTTFYDKADKAWESLYFDYGKLMEIIFIKDPFGGTHKNEFKDGNGIAKFYNHDASMHSEVNYKDGVKDGRAIYYHDGSRSILKKYATGNYSNGERTGGWSFYKGDGELFKTVSYLGGGKSHQINYNNRSGKTEADYLYANLHGQVKNYNAYNELKSNYTYRNGHMHGKYVEDRGVLTEKGEYCFGTIKNNVNFYRGDKLRLTDTIVNDISVDSSFYELNKYSYRDFRKTTDFKVEKHSLKASFIGGWEKEAEHVLAYIKYPKRAKENKVKGNVILEITVNSLGEATHINLIKGIGYGCNEEAIRLVEQMPFFEPALYRGIPVESTLIRSIEFPKRADRTGSYDFNYRYNYGLKSDQLIHVTSFE